jgi:hypothetical protein
MFVNGTDNSTGSYIYHIYTPQQSLIFSQQLTSVKQMPVTQEDMDRILLLMFGKPAPATTPVTNFVTKVATPTAVASVVQGITPKVVKSVVQRITPPVVTKVVKKVVAKVDTPTAATSKVSAVGTAILFIATLPWRLVCGVACLVRTVIMAGINAVCAAIVFIGTLLWYLVRGAAPLVRLVMMTGLYAVKAAIVIIGVVGFAEICISIGYMLPQYLKNECETPVRSAWYWNWSPEPIQPWFCRYSWSTKLD